MTPVLAAAARRWVVQTASRPYLAIYTEALAELSGEDSWFRALVGGLPESRFQIEGLDPAAAGRLGTAQWPSTVSFSVPLPLPAADRRAAGARRERFETALADLVTVLAAPDPVSEASGSTFEAALAALSNLGNGRPLSPLLQSDSAARRVLDAWRGALQPAADALLDAPRPYPSRLSEPGVTEALALCGWLCRALRPLEAQPPAANLAHAVGGGAPGLAALHGWWRNATPFVLSEPQIALREHYLKEDRLKSNRAETANIRIMRLRFERRLAHTVYRRASALIAGSERVRRWQVQLGASPAQITLRSGGLRLSRPDWLSQPVFPEPTGAVVVWCGEVGPGANLETLLRAFDLVRRRRPEARLRLCAQAVGHADDLARCQALIVSLRLGSCVAFEVLPSDHSAADRAEIYRSAQVVVLSGSTEEVPAALLDAMTLGRAVAAVRVGGVPDVLGAAGLLSAPNDLLALARHLLRLLGDAALRRQLAEVGRQRAALFSADAWVQLHRQLYARVLTEETLKNEAVRADAGNPVGEFSPGDFEFGDEP
ncbi:DUF3492 domain-containing protein [Deinococcus alpinitundrae]|uniref:DUF3492 domain-containing protein n=1 Tax=Deinococcus alpinitundrae TaxID=468913 RepID=UPI00137ABA03|nr:DUF3492 domain-containing protein [Deinococcus alpinitundrae]